MRNTLHVVSPLFIFCLVYTCAAPIGAQAIGTAISATGTLPNANAMLDVQSPTSGNGKGMLVPRVTANQRTNASAALAGGLLDDTGDLRGGAAQGLLVYQTDGQQGFYYNTSATATPSWSYVGDGDFMADGSVAMTGDLNLGDNAITNAMYYGDGSGLTNIPSGSISLTGHDVTELDDVSSAGSGAIITASERGLIATNQTAIASETAARIGADAGLSNNVSTLQSDTSFISNNYVRRDGTLSMTGDLDMGGQIISNVDSVIYFDSFAVGVGKLANPGGGGVAVGYMADGNFDGAALGNQANGYIAGAVLGHQARGDWYGSSVGGNANAQYEGVAVGYYANGSLTNVAIGYYANAQGGNKRIAIGHNVTNLVNNSAAIRGNLYLDGATNVMVRSSFGSGAWTPLVGAAGDFKSDGSVAMTGNLNMGGQNISGVASNIAFTGDEIIIGKDATADYGFDGVAIGSTAHGDYQGVGVGYQANAAFGGVSMGYQARSYYFGVAVGYQSFATNYGAAVGREANAVYYGAALGANAKAQIEGAAVGGSANGIREGVAIGYFANGCESGIAIGYDAIGLGTNIAIGYLASTHDSDHINGGDRIAIGRAVTNRIEDSCRIRGTLYLDGGTGVLYRSTFNSGAWSVKAFTIDHPLDPENKVLRHYCMEGPEVWNVYAGNARLENGKAIVELPDYYSALNAVGSEVYSLTVIDESVNQFPQVKIARKVANNAFVIRGSHDVEVSWSIKVLRNDPGCIEDLKRRPVEQLKSELMDGQMEIEHRTLNTYGTIHPAATSN